MEYVKNTHKQTQHNDQTTQQQQHVGTHCNRQSEKRTEQNQSNIQNTHKQNTHKNTKHQQNNITTNHNKQKTQTQTCKTHIIHIDITKHDKTSTTNIEIQTT